MSCTSTTSELQCFSVPRNPGRCFRCDQPIQHPVQNGTAHTVRSPDFERQLIEEAAKSVCDPSSLIDHALTRAHSLSGPYVSDPLHIKPGLDRRREAREELADCANHISFQIQERLGELEDEERHDLLVALRFVCLAYDKLLESV